MQNNHSVISKDPKMTSLTLHLIVIALLAAAAMTAVTAAGTGTDTELAARSVGQRRRGAVPSSSTTTTTTQTPTLRAPRQRRPPTTLPINDGNGRRRGSSSTTPLPATSPRPQRRRGTTTATTTTTTSTFATPTTSVSFGNRRDSGRGSVRAARQPRDTPTQTAFDGSIDGRFNNADSIKSRRQANAVASISSRNGFGALKTSRMIQRLVAGHIHNAQGHSTYEVSAVSSNSSQSIAKATITTTTTASATTATTTTTTNIPLLHARRKASSSYRMTRPSPSPPSPVAQNQDDDEALLNEPDDFDNWDNGILRLSAGGGKESEPAKGSGNQSKEDAKKTLADQVRDGKYGLIEKELFRRVPKRPGILSYARNSEVPVDNERNFGGLNEENIWLAEDHLLVIKGGSLNEAGINGEGNNDDAWPVIDDYDAPLRQIKLPANPVVPPPFPVQLEPHGPLQLIRDNQIESLNPTAINATISAAPRHASNSQNNGAAHGSGTYTAARPGAIASPKAVDSKPTYVYPAPYAPWLYPNETLGHPPSLSTLPRSPLLGPWLINGLHAGANISGSAPAALHSNISDFDEDDPSLYYPPAYSFVYRSNYSNPVPPGPLVPGIVLPPPPDHFSRLEPTVATTISTSSPTTTTTTTTRRPFISSSSSTSTTTSSFTSTSTSSSTSTTRAPSRLSLKYNAIGYLSQSATPRQPNKYVERVPVPVAVPIPIYPVNYQLTTPLPQPQTRPQPTAQLVFVSSSSSTERSRDRNTDRDQPLLSKSNPIYYEYFEAKRQPSGHKSSNAINEFLATRPPKRLYNKLPPSPANDVSVVSITPKPRLPIQLNSEYDSDLGQLLRSNIIPTSPSNGRFQPPDFDRQPFLPMVNYSTDEQDQNAFKAIVYQPQPQRQRQLRVGKHQQLHLHRDREQDQESYLPDSLLLQRQRQLRMGKQQFQQSPLPYDSGQQIVYSTSLPPPPLSSAYLDNQLQTRPAAYQLRPSQFNWQRQQLPQVPPAAPQFKRLRQNNAKHPNYPPFSFVPSYANGPAPSEPLYRLVPVSQHKQWRQPGNKLQQQQNYYSDRGVNIGHSLASDILVNYNTNNQFNPQAELVPQAQLGPPPLSYQAQNGGQASLWSERSVRQSRAQLQEQP